MKIKVIIGIIILMGLGIYLLVTSTNYTLRDYSCEEIYLSFGGECLLKTKIVGFGRICFEDSEKFIYYNLICEGKENEKENEIIKLN